MTEVRVLKANDAEKWNSLVEKNPYASAYHLWDWGEVLSLAYGYERHYVAASKGNKIIGVLPLVHVKSRFFGNRLISLPFCEYGGPLTDYELDDQETKKVMQKLVGTATELASVLNVEYVEIRNCRVPVAKDVLLFGGYNDYVKYLTFRIDLTKSSETLWKSLNRKTRNAVRKAMKRGVEAKEVRGEEQLKDYYKLYLATQKRHGSPPNSFKLFEKLYDAFFHKNKTKVLLAEYKGKPIAGIIAFYHNNIIYWWNNVTDSKHRSLNPTNLLLWNIIEWGANNGYQMLELGRTRKETTIHRFKSGWGGKEVLLPDHVYFLNSKKMELPDPMQTRYTYLSKVWSFMPTSLAKRIGPKIVSGIAL